MKLIEAFTQGTKQGKAIVSCLDKVYRPDDLNLKWLSETAVISDAVMNVKEYKGQWTVDDDCSKELSTLELTKEQWEEVYQWYLTVKEDYTLKPYQVAAAEKIANMLIEKYESFR